MNKVELMAPAGDWTMLNAAISSGADAVYFGIGNMNMRVKATNFQLNELADIVKLCKENNVKSYLTLNTIIYEEEIPYVEEIIIKAKETGVDAIICWDLSVVELSKKYDMPFCISTQASISNSMSANFYAGLGAKRVVLARECSLKEMKSIIKNTDIEIEAFVHGAMCIAVSGRCFMSHHLFGKSANKGECIQPCRREFEVTDVTTHKSMVIGEDYVLSPQDLCTIEFIDQLVEAGIHSFKIEGRKRSPEYVAKTVSIYRKAIDLYYEGKLTKEIKKEFFNELGNVYNRGFSAGFYFDIPSSTEYAGIHGSRATTKKAFVGKVINYYKEAKVAYVNLETGSLKPGDEILIMGPTTGVVSMNITSIMVDDKVAELAGKGDRLTFPCETLLRPSDSVYIVKKVEAFF